MRLNNFQNHPQHQTQPRKYWNQPKVLETANSFLMDLWLSLSHISSKHTPQPQTRFRWSRKHCLIQRGRSLPWTHNVLWMRCLTLQIPYHKIRRWQTFAKNRSDFSRAVEQLMSLVTLKGLLEWVVAVLWFFFFAGFTLS